VFELKTQNSHAWLPFGLLLLFQYVEHELCIHIYMYSFIHILCHLYDLGCYVLFARANGFDADT
jgi:hypothetical protein